jgi:acetyl-CoA carboxylase carboxyltransferase component
MPLSPNERRKRRLLNRDNANEKQRKYRRLHQDDTNEKQRKFRRLHQDDTNEKQRKYRRLHQDDTNERQRKHRQLHQDDTNERQRKYRCLRQQERVAKYALDREAEFAAKGNFSTPTNDIPCNTENYELTESPETGVMNWYQCNNGDYIGC